MFKEGLNNIQDEDRPSRPKMVSISKIVDSANTLSYIEDISEHLWISVGAAYKIVHNDLPFSKVSCCWAMQGFLMQQKQ